MQDVPSINKSQNDAKKRLLGFISIIKDKKITDSKHSLRLRILSSSAKSLFAFEVSLRLRSEISQVCICPIFILSLSFCLRSLSSSSK